MRSTERAGATAPVTQPSIARAIAREAAPDAQRVGRAVAALTAAALLSFALSPTPASADEISDLRDMIRQLEARIKALEAERAPPKAQVIAPAAPVTPDVPVAAAAPAPVPESSESPYVPAATMKADEASSPRVDNAVIDPTMKGFFKIPGTDTIIKIGGYAKVDFIYDTKPIGTFDYFVTSAIPTSGPDTQRGSNFTVHAKQTRLNLDLRRDTDLGKARLYFEGDWFGDASYGFSQGGYKFRLRHAFGQVSNFAAGYSFSAFMDNDALPDTLDFEGPGSAAYLTLAGARYTWKVGANANLSVAAEAPSADITVPVGGGRSTFPDVTMRARYEADRGHLQLSGVWRKLGWRSGEGPGDTTNGYGINLAGSLKTVGDDYVVAGGIWGKGIARYISDITGLGLDAVVDPDGNLQALEAYGGYAGYTHYWSPKLRSTAVVNYLGMSSKSWQAGSSFSNSQYYSANLIWNPAGSFNVGLELLYGRYRTYDGLSANDTRIQASVQYDFVR